MKPKCQQFSHHKLARCGQKDRVFTKVGKLCYTVQLLYLCSELTLEPDP